YDIYMMNADGTDERRLTHSNAQNTSPNWSPDGQYIAYVSWHDDVREIFVMNADGSNQRQLTHDGYDDAPVWSPDGQQILFGSTGGVAYWSLSVINSDGSNLRHVPLYFNSENLPVWQP